MRIQIVGRGRMATALEAALGASGVDLLPLAGRGADGTDVDGVKIDGTGAGGTGADSPAVDLVILAVPDAEIANAARGIRPGPLVGHCSGATGLDVLAPHEAFGLHPLLTVLGPETSFAGSFAAVDGTTERALEAARDLAARLGAEPFRVADVDRAAYHAAASIASNFVVTLEGFAERLAATAGVPRRALVPLVQAAVENWASVGAPDALTGPIARGDDATVARQRAAVAERLPDRADLFDALAAATRDLAATRGPVGPHGLAATRDSSAPRQDAAGAPPGGTP